MMNIQNDTVYKCTLEACIYIDKYSQTRRQDLAHGGGLGAAGKIELYVKKVTEYFQFIFKPLYLDTPFNIFFRIFSIKVLNPRAYRGFC